MKISIITPTFNQDKFIEKTILSVLDQKYIDFEHIIIDGGSNDGTVEILKKYKHLKWVSEKDDGQADALNKGLKLVTGDIVGWINSDDYYLPGAFNTVVSYFRDVNVQWVIGNIKYYYLQVKKFKNVVSPCITFDTLLKDPDIVRQQSAFFRKDTIIKVGGWNKNYYMVMDYDLWVRMARITKPLMISDYLAVYVHHPLQKSNYKNIITQTIELVEILIKEKSSYIYIIKLIFKKSKNLFFHFVKIILIKFNIIDEKYKTVPISLSEE